MPESPEVQALVEYLDERLRGRTLASVELLEFRALKTRARPLEQLGGSSVTRLSRAGKHVVMQLEGAVLVLSLGRHGWVRYSPPGGATETPSDVGSDPPPPALAILEFDDGASVEVTDAGGWISIGLSVVDRETEVAAIAKLGPDPASDDVSAADVEQVMKGRRKQIKAILQEQESLAGIGNAYSDEILWAGRVAPTTLGAALDDERRAGLAEATVRVVVDAIDARRGVPIDRLKAEKVAAMAVHGRAGEPCPRCGTTIEDLAFGGTTAQMCPVCQPA